MVICMAKNCVITLDPSVVVEATEKAHKQGKSLKEVIEAAIINTASNKRPGSWLTEKALEDLDWAPSRITLFQMRQDGRLQEGVHYKRQGRFIYYNKRQLFKGLYPAKRRSRAKVAEASGVA